METTQRWRAADAKRVYYLSMEFLIGRTLSNALHALGLYDELAHAGIVPSHPVMAAAGFVGQDEPALVAPALALDADLRAQARLEVGDSIPARAEQRRGHVLQSPAEQLQAQPVNAAMSKAPDQRTVVGIDPGHAQHAGTQTGRVFGQFGFVGGCVFF